MRFIALIKVDSVYVYSDTYYKLPEEPNLIRLKKKRKKKERNYRIKQHKMLLKRNV